MGKSYGLLSGVANLISKFTAQIVLIFSNFFFKKFRLKSLKGLQTSNPMAECSHLSVQYGLQLFPLNLTAQIFLTFEIWRF